MRRLTDWYHNIRLRNKLAVSFIVLSSIPFIVYALVSSGIFLSQTRETATEHTLQMTAQASNSIDVYISGIDKLASFWVKNIQRGGMLSMTAQDPAWKSIEASVRKSLQDLAESHQEIAGILIALDDNRYISTSMTRISRDPFTGESWYRLAEENPGRFSLISSVTGRNIVTNETYSFDDVFSLVRPIPDPATGEARGVILFDVRHDIIRDSIDQASIGRQGFAFILDDNDEIVYTPANKVVYRINPLLLDYASPTNLRIGDGSYHIRTYRSAFTGWKTVGVFSMNEVFRGVNTLYPILALSIGVVIVLVILVSLRISNSVTRPISKLQTLMHAAEQGDLSVRFNSRYSDEIGNLGRSFNHMIERINGLIKRVYQEQQSKRDAELKSLQEQIKPHFLYNTLDTISWMARDQGATEIVRLIDALTNMFRVGLSHGKDFIPVRQEITHISNYLYIQKTRYQDKLNYDIQIDAALHDHTIPKLILQPLIENAIYHGIKQKRGAGWIAISGCLEQGGALLCFVVEDNGAGIEPEKLAALQAALRNVLRQEEKQSFGLFYVAERIQLCYGEQYGVFIDSEWGAGARVTIRLPAQEGGPAHVPSIDRR